MNINKHIALHKVRNALVWIIQGPIVLYSDELSAKALALNREVLELIWPSKPRRTKRNIKTDI